MENIKINIDLNPLLAAMLVNAMYLNELIHFHKGTTKTGAAMTREVLDFWTDTVQLLRQAAQSPPPSAETDQEDEH